MKNILITGGTGFIGSHTCVTLLSEGYNVYLIDSLVNSSKISLLKIEEIFRNKNIDITNKLRFFEGDIRKKDFIDYVFKTALKEKKAIDGVIHFAGLKAVAESVIKPLNYWENNVLGSYNLIKIMEENNCKTIVFSSSATVYGNTSEDFLNEEFSLVPTNPYGATKLTVEKMLNDIYQNINENWKIAILRYFNPIGAHKSGLIGENPLQKPNNIFPIIINSAYTKKKLKVFGNDWPTTDGTCIRDYVHVMDLADGHIKALDFLFRNKTQLIKLNIGTGKGHSVLDLIKTFENANNVSVPFEFDKRRDGDVCHLVADNSKAKSILNWSPAKSLKEMCIDGWKWKNINPKGYM
ncbi:UDP-glucose 4-epimerase GalE [Prochlorococcus sp. AH-736-B04]|nr:UDP-glucose 4-epimerase GalE [Prochlorococcus sp. AH-736-B04]